MAEFWNIFLGEARLMLSAVSFGLALLCVAGACASPILITFDPETRPHVPLTKRLLQSSAAFTGLLTLAAFLLTAAKLLFAGYPT